MPLSVFYEHHVSSTLVSRVIFVIAVLFLLVGIILYGCRVSRKPPPYTTTLLVCGCLLAALGGVFALLEIFEVKMWRGKTRKSEQRWTSGQDRHHASHTYNLVLYICIRLLIGHISSILTRSSPEECHFGKVVWQSLTCNFHYGFMMRTNQNVHITRKSIFGPVGVNRFDTSWIGRCQEQSKSGKISMFYRKKRSPFEVLVR